MAACFTGRLERDLFGFPKPGDPYWNEQTLADVAARYPGMDLTPYRPGTTADRPDRA